MRMHDIYIFVLPGILSLFAPSACSWAGPWLISSHLLTENGHLGSAWSCQWLSIILRGLIFFSIIYIFDIWNRTLYLLLGLADFIVLLELTLRQKLRDAEIQVSVEELKVDINSVGRTSAEVCLGTDSKPVFHGKVDCLGYIKSKVEALVICRSPRYNELAFFVKCLHHLESLLSECLRMHERSLMPHELWASLRALWEFLV